MTGLQLHKDILEINKTPCHHENDVCTDMRKLFLNIKMLDLILTINQSEPIKTHSPVQTEMESMRFDVSVIDKRCILMFVSFYRTLSFEKKKRSFA